MEGMFLVLHDYEDGHQIRFHIPHIVCIDECKTENGKLLTTILVSEGHGFRVKESADEIQEFLTKIVRWR